MREISSMSFLANLRPQFAYQQRTGNVNAQPEPETIGEDFDSVGVQKRIDESKTQGTKDILSQYDLRNISREDIMSLTTVLHDRNEISNSSFNILFTEGALASPDSSSEKFDFLGFLEQKMENLPTTGDSRQDGMIKKVIMQAGSALQSIDKAKSNGADHVVFSNKI